MDLGAVEIGLLLQLSSLLQIHVSQLSIVQVPLQHLNLLHQSASIPLELLVLSS